LSILWLSMALGLSLTNKMARLWPGASTAFSLHEYVSLLGLTFAVYHGLVLMGDHFVDFSMLRLMLPFSIEYLTLWTGLGQLAFYVWLFAALSFYIRQRIGQKTWRKIHYLNFATYVMGFFHGVYSGWDSAMSWARVYYWVSGLSLLGLLGYRVYVTVAQKKAAPPKAVTRTPQPSVQAPVPAAGAPPAAPVPAAAASVEKSVPVPAPVEARVVETSPKPIPTPVRVAAGMQAARPENSITRPRTDHKLPMSPTLPNPRRRAHPASEEAVTRMMRRIKRSMNLGATRPS
jgi:cytochrome b561